MANKTLFTGLRGKLLPFASGLNNEKARAYDYSPRQKLAQLAVTGCLNGTFYVSAEDQLDEVLSLAQKIDPAFVAKTAVYARRSGYMKDMPALLLACLTVANNDGENGRAYFASTFNAVIDNGRMLRTFVQIMRSGVVGRKSLGTAPKRMVQEWLQAASDKQLINACVGKDPSLADVIKMVHPKPLSAKRQALFAYLIGREYDHDVLPQALRDFEAFKSEGGDIVPDVPFQMLTSLNLNAQHWLQIARRSGWHMVRMNLNTFARNGVFEIKGAAKEIAARLRNKDAIRKAKVFPYQLMAAYTASSGADLPGIISEALQEALDISLANVPVFAGNVVVCPDVSGSMHSPVTGYRRGGTTAVRCIDVAGLMASVVMRQSMDAKVLPFEYDVCKIALNPRDSVMTNATKLANIGGGATNCSAPIALLNAKRAKVDLVILVSDNESWVDGGRFGRGSTSLMREWSKLKSRNPNARLVCIDIQPYGTSQTYDRDDVLNIGGFSDRVFDVIAKFINDDLDPENWPKSWIAEIEKTTERILN